ncbi:MAG: DUF1844 domain-containing protein [Bacteroidia bacterium]
MQNEDQLFTQLISIFYSSAMVALGKIKNPATDKIERDLAQAGQAIDMLELIKSKTNGNLSSQQNRMLEAALTDLRLNFVDEKQKDSIPS